MGFTYLMARLPCDHDPSRIIQFLYDQNVSDVVLSRCACRWPPSTNCDCSQRPDRQHVDAAALAPADADADGALAPLSHVPADNVSVILLENGEEMDDANGRMIHESVHKVGEESAAVMRDSIEEENEGQDTGVEGPPEQAIGRAASPSRDAQSSGGTEWRDQPDGADQNVLARGVNAEDVSIHSAQSGGTERAHPDDADGENVLVHAEEAAREPVAVQEQDHLLSDDSCMGMETEERENGGAVQTHDEQREEKEEEKEEEEEEEGDLLGTDFPAETVVVEEKADRPTKQQCTKCKKSVTVYSYGGKGRRTRYVSMSKTLNHVITHVKLPARFKCSKCGRECSRMTAMSRHLQAGCGAKGGQTVKGDYTRQQRELLRRAVNRCFPHINDK